MLVTREPVLTEAPCTHLTVDCGFAAGVVTERAGWDCVEWLPLVS